MEDSLLDVAAQLLRRKRRLDLALAGRPGLCAPGPTAALFFVPNQAARGMVAVAVTGAAELRVACERDLSSVGLLRGADVILLARAATMPAWEQADLIAALRQGNRQAQIWMLTSHDLRGDLTGGA